MLQAILNTFSSTKLLRHVPFCLLCDFQRSNPNFRLRLKHAHVFAMSSYMHQLVAICSLCGGGHARLHSEGDKAIMAWYRNTFPVP